MPVDPDRAARAGELEHVLLRRAKPDLDLRFRSVGQAQPEDRSVVLAPGGAHDRRHVLDLGVEQEPEEIDVMRCQIEEGATAVGPGELPGRQVLPGSVNVVRMRLTRPIPPSRTTARARRIAGWNRRLNPIAATIPAAPRRVDDPLPVGEARGQRLLEVEVTTRLGDGDPKLCVEAARRRDEDGVDVVAGKQLVRAAAERGVRRSASGRGERRRVGIGERSDRDSCHAREHGEMHRPRDRAASDRADANGLHVRDAAPGGSRTR